VTFPDPALAIAASVGRYWGRNFASTDVPRSAMAIRGEDKITWRPSSEKSPSGLLFDLRFVTVLGSAFS
jgi:hypothetical protein